MLPIGAHLGGDLDDRPRNSSEAARTLVCHDRSDPQRRNWFGCSIFPNMVFDAGSAAALGMSWLDRGRRNPFQTSDEVKYQGLMRPQGKLRWRAERGIGSLLGLRAV
jgi:hypothetical protein